MIEKHFLREKDFDPFLATMLKATAVVGPVAKKDKFVFETLREPKELRLDYDVTILPPKKVIFPTTQELLSFKGQKARSSICVQEKILFGVHFYDIKAIDMLDELFTRPYDDRNYTANRQALTLVGSNIHAATHASFYASASQELEPKGHDAFLTKIEGGYLFEVLTEKGQKLLQYGAFQKAQESQIVLAAAVNAKALQKCPKALPVTGQQLNDKIRASYGKLNAWKKVSEDCFSCGSCNIVCPTCYCFDVQDQWNLDQVSGNRCRSWDGCMLPEFAEVSLGNDMTENFRETAATRTRHRIMRKTAYLNDKLGAQACVGCGRCTISCVPDIADPVEVITKVLEAADE